MVAGGGSCGGPPAIVPECSISNPVGDPVVAGILHLAGHQVGDVEVPWAAGALPVRARVPVPARAVPAAGHCRGVQARAASARGGSFAMAHGAVLAEAADPEFRVLADARRWMLR